MSEFESNDGRREFLKGAAIVSAATAGLGLVSREAKAQDTKTQGKPVTTPKVNFSVVDLGKRSIAESFLAINWNDYNGFIVTSNDPVHPGPWFLMDRGRARYISRTVATNLFVAVPCPSGEPHL